MENHGAVLERPIDGNFVKFYHRRVLDALETKKSGRDKYKYLPYVRIKSPGQEKQVTDREVTENVLFDWKHRFPQPASADYIRAFEEFKTLEHQQIDGTPLDQWQEISRDRADMLRRHGITTIENLAAVPDAGCGIGPGKVVSIELRNKAVEFLKGDSEREVRARLAEKDEENKRLETHIKTQQDQLKSAQSDLASALARLTELEKKIEPSIDMSERIAGDGDNGPDGDRRVGRSDGSTNTGAGKAKPKRGRKA